MTDVKVQILKIIAINDPTRAIPCYEPLTDANLGNNYTDPV